MFENLSNRLSKIIKNIYKRGSLTENSIKDILNKVRVALLEADVSLSVVNSVIDNVRVKAIGHIVSKGLTPSQEFVKIVHDVLVGIMGGDNFLLNLSEKPPVVLLIVGFQGSGKTTTCAKIAKYLSIKEKKKVLLSSVDFYRPSGIRQLEILAGLASVDFVDFSDRDINNTKNVIDVASNFFAQAKLGFYDVLLIDTVGCSSADVSLFSEIANLASCLRPVEILFVVDAMLGQESVNIASFFSSKLLLTGVVLTKVDGDSRGGAALSIYHTINKPIKFIGTGEKIDNLEQFHSVRMASRILGMGDVLSLIEDIENKVEGVHVENTLSKLKQGGVFDLSDFLNHLRQMRNLGGINRILSKLPVVNNNFSDILKSKIDDNSLVMMEVIINSMTIKERRQPNIIHSSRKRRIAYGAGVSVQNVNILLKRFQEVQSVMVKISKNGLSKVLNSLQNKLFS